MELAQELVILLPPHLAEPVIPAREQREYGAERQHIVEVGDDVIGVVHVIVDAAIGEDAAGDAADREHEDGAQGPEHRRLEVNGSASVEEEMWQYADRTM